MKKPASQSGVLTIELALWLPLLCLMFFGMLEFGSALNVKGRLADATTAGLRWAAHGGSRAWDLAAIEAEVRANLGDVQNPVSVMVEHRCHCPSAQGDQLIEVSCLTGQCSLNGADTRPFTYVWIQAETEFALSQWIQWPEMLRLQSRQGLRID